MWGDEAELKVVRERMKLLLDIHRQELAPTRRIASEGELLMRQGEPAERLILLTRGKVAIQLHLLDPEPHTLAVIEAEELLGEMGLFGNGTHAADVRVVEGPAELIEVCSDNVMKTLLFDVDLVMELLALVSQRCLHNNTLIGLLLDGIAAAHRGNPAQVEALRSKYGPLTYCVSKAVTRLEEIAVRRS